MKKSLPKPLGRKIVESLEDFVKRLESGEPIKATEVRRVDTPDGPMHVREEATLNEGSISGH